MENTQNPQNPQKQQELHDKLSKLQGLQNQIQAMAMQKQQVIMHANEIENALKELKVSNDKIYKISGPILIEANKETTEKELTGENEKLKSMLSIYDKNEKNLSGELKRLSEDLKTMMGGTNRAQ